MTDLIDNTIKAEWTSTDALDLQPTCNQLATDTISRQAAIDEIVAWLKDRMGDGKNGKPLTDRLKDLPSAQEIIRCKDCKHYRLSEVCDEKFMCKRKDVDGFLVCYDFSPNDFCSYAERRDNDE